MKITQTTEHLCKRYLAAMNDSNLAAVLALFTPDATVLSPLYGERPVADFFAGLFADTQRSKTTLIRRFDSSHDGAAVALQFHYVWTMASGKVFGFEVVDVFELSADKKHFCKLTIIYDTAPLRADFVALQADAAN